MSPFRDRNDLDPASSRRTGARRARSAKPINEQALYEYALGVLGRGMRTEAELRRLLQRRLSTATLVAPTQPAHVDDILPFGQEPDAAAEEDEGAQSRRAALSTAMMEAVLTRLRSHQYLSDTRYAAAFASLRRDGRRLGARRVAQDLRAKGVPVEIIAREVETAYEGTTEEAQARAFLAKKRVKPPEPGDDRDKARILRLLARAGFSPAVAWNILRHWNVAPDECPDEG